MPPPENELRIVPKSGSADDLRSSTARAAETDPVYVSSPTGRSVQLRGFFEQASESRAVSTYDKVFEKPAAPSAGDDDDKLTSILSSDYSEIAPTPPDADHQPSGQSSYQDDPTTENVDNSSADDSTCRMSSGIAANKDEENTTGARGCYEHSYLQMLPSSPTENDYAKIYADSANEPTSTAADDRSSGQSHRCKTRVQSKPTNVFPTGDQYANLPENIAGEPSDGTQQQCQKTSSKRSFHEVKNFWQPVTTEQSNSATHGSYVK